MTDPLPTSLDSAELERHVLRSWTGAGWRVVALPGRNLVLSTADGELTVDDQDVEFLCDALLACADDGCLRTYDSCLMPYEADPTDLPRSSKDWFIVSVSADSNDETFLAVDAQYSSLVSRVARSEAHALAVALLNANDHVTLGPCPWCGVSLADDHPVNGCP